MKHRIISALLFFLTIAALAAPSPVLAETEDEAMPVRLHFVNALDANVYTERLVYEVFNRLGINISLTLENMDIALRGVNSGIYDGICNQTAGVEDDYDQLVRIPIETAVCRFYALSMDTESFVCSSWADLGGKRVGSLSGKPFVTGAMPPDIAAYVERPTMSLLYDALHAGECDVIILADSSDKEPSDLVVPSDVRIAGVVDTHSCAIFLNQQYAALVEPVTRELEKMRLDGTMARLKAMKPLEERGEQTVLYLSSYSSEMLWEQGLLKGIGDVLNQHLDIIYHNIALNAFRNTDQTLMEVSALSTLSVDFIHSPPDAVIVSDNEALYFLIANFNAILPNDTPIIYCGLNEKAVAEALQYSQYIGLQGILETIYAADTVEQMLSLFPSTEEIYVINDYSLTGRRWRSEIETQLAPLEGRVQIAYNENLPFEELLAEVAGLGDNALVLTGSYYLDRDNRYFPQPSAQSRLFEASPVPIFGLLDTSQGFGQLGGKRTDAVLHGQAAANMVVDLLRTGDFDQYTFVEREEDSRWVFDSNIMKKYGIRKDALPQGATLLNARVPLRQSDPALFWGLIITAVAAAIIILLLAAFTILLNERNRKLIKADTDILASRTEIEAAKDHLQTILDTAPIAYSLLVNDVVVESNSYYKQHVGTMDGQKNADKYADGNGDEEKKRYNQLMKECRQKGFVGNIYWHIPNENGTRVRYLYNIARSQYEGQEAIVMWGVEIEQLERQKDALNRAYADLQAMIENAPLSISVLCPSEKTLVLANPAWRALFRIPESLDIMGIHWDELGALTARPLNSFIDDAMKTDDTVSTEWVLRSYDGETFEALVYIKRIVYGGKDCAVVSYRDLREEKARERLLQSAANKEREANRLKSHFLMNMSHEIRTPLNAIIGITQLANPYDEADILYEAIGSVGHAASVLLNIVNDVLDLALIEDGRMVLRPKPARLSQTIHDLDAVLGVEMDNKGLSRSINLDGVIHDTVVMDPSRLQQVILALATNAIKFTKTGGHVSMAVAETEEPDNLSTFKFTVRDTGIGIAPDKMDRLFKPFEQGDDSITREYGGAGLGLSIAKSVIELMGGDMWAESELGEGSTFYFTIRVPVVPEAAEVTIVSKENDASDVAASSQSEMLFPNLRVLLVDDVEINRLIAIEMLSKMGCVIEEAENGRQAVEILTNAAPGYYDLVFMDVQMPVLDGCSATKEIRALGRPDLASIPIVAMTAHVMPDDIQMVLDAGMNGHVGKPIFWEQLVEAIAANVK